VASAGYRTIQTPTLEIAYEASGPANGVPVILLHGFPDDPRAYDGTLDPLGTLGCRILVPWLRGYGPTRFLDPAALRSGQQAALGSDLLAFMDALAIPEAVLVGYDWGGRAACIVAALWPERCRGLVSGGYSIQNIALADRPASAASEYRAWYQWYFHTERGRAGLEKNRRDICRLLWQLWSPNWRFDEATFERTAVSFDNPDFVDVVIHSYRHRYGAAAGEPALEPIERRLAEQPSIAVPTVVLDGEADGVDQTSTEDRAAAHFTGPYERRLIPSAGHFLPHEAPDAVVAAVETLLV
jgi:pimeloyl-ACP methyl ester carboxylesterase